MLGTAAEIDAVPFCVRESIKAGTWGWYNPKFKIKNATFSIKCCILENRPIIYIFAEWHRREKKLIFFKIGVKFCRKAPKYSV